MKVIFTEEPGVFDWIGGYIAGHYVVDYAYRNAGYPRLMCGRARIAPEFVVHDEPESTYTVLQDGNGLWLPVVSARVIVELGYREKRHAESRARREALIREFQIMHRDTDVSVEELDFAVLDEVDSGLEVDTDHDLDID